MITRGKAVQAGSVITWEWGWVLYPVVQAEALLFF